jgi:hypothetical protein
MQKVTIFDTKGFQQYQRQIRDEFKLLPYGLKKEAWRNAQFKMKNGESRILVASTPILQ